MILFIVITYKLNFDTDFIKIFFHYWKITRVTKNKDKNFLDVQFLRSGRKKK